MTNAIGIDLGTTYTCAAIVEDGEARVIRSRLGYSTIPSVVTFDDDGNPIVGQQAERRMVLKPEETIYGSKRLLGRPFESGSHMEYQPHFHYELVPGADGLIAARVGNRMTSLIEVAALILLECRKAAEDSLGRTIEHAVVTVPAYFNETQRDCVRKAAKHVGLDILRIIPEPTAAALSYGARDGLDKRLLIFDLGGGTFDVSIVKVASNVFEVEAVDGDSFLGGIDFDQLLAALILERATADRDDDVELSKIDRERLRQVAQTAKHELSEQPTAMITLPHVSLPNGDVIHIEETISRQELEEVTSELVDHCVAIVVRTIERAGLEPAKIDDILLVGGQTRMPLVQRKLEELFGKPPSKRVHPDEVVALGAAIAAHAHDKFDAPLLLDVVPMAIGIAVRDGKFGSLVPVDTPLPHKTSAKFTTPVGETMRLAFLQGGAPIARDNDYLGAVVLKGLPAEGGAPCRLDLELDAEGRLRIFATIPDWGKRHELRLDRREPLLPILIKLGEDTSEVSQVVQLRKKPGLVGAILGRLRRRRRKGR